MSLRKYDCLWTTQLYQIRWFHAIFMPVIIGFSRCISTYLSAKFELFRNKKFKKSANIGDRGVYVCPNDVS